MSLLSTSDIIVRNMLSLPRGTVRWILWFLGGLKDVHCRVDTDMESTAGSEITGELGSPSPSLQQCWSVVVGLAADRSRLSAADAGQSTCCSCSDISQLRAEQPAALSSQTPHCSCSALHSLSPPSSNHHKQVDPWLHWTIKMFYLTKSYKCQIFSSA